MSKTILRAIILFAVVASLATGALAQPYEVKLLSDVSYLPAGRTEKLDLYLPIGRAPGTTSPAMVLIHGGGWAAGDKASSREQEIGRLFASRGYVCASVNYEMREGKRWPTNLLDCKNAVRSLRANAAKYGVDEGRIGVLGGSAGGHLALMVAYTTGVPGLEPERPYPGTSSRVNCVINMYGITDLLTRQKITADGVPTGEVRQTTALFKPTMSQDPRLWRFASPVTHVKPASPPTLTLHGLADATVDYEQANELARVLDQKGAPNKLVLLKGVGHSFTLDAWRKKPLEPSVEPVVLEFLKEHLGSPK